MIEKNKDIIIAALEFARLKLLNGEPLNRSDLNNYLLEQKYITPEYAIKNDILIGTLFDQIFTYSNGTKPSDRLMGLDSYLGLLDYEELQLAREDSAQARREAKQAIENAAEATRLTEKALFWTKVSVITATVVGIIQIIVAFAKP